MISAQQARMKSKISSNMNEEIAYRNLTQSFTMMLKVYCAKGEVNMILPTKKAEAYNERFIQALVSKGYEVDAKDYSYEIFW